MSEEPLGILGGSFNPVHNGHLSIAASAMAHAGLRQVSFLPTGTPPHKPQGLAPAARRLDMLRLALQGHQDFTIEEAELWRPGNSYTVDTLRLLRSRWPRRPLWLLVGADTLMDLLTWREPETVFSLAGFLACARPGIDLSAVEGQVEALAAHGARVRMLPVTGPEVSSTDIRRRVAAGQSIRGLVPEAVADYIREFHLYESE